MDYNDDDDKDDRDSFLSDKEYSNDRVMRSSSDVDSAPHSNKESNSSKASVNRPQV